MGRKPRLDFAGALHHVIVRGNDRQPIFRDRWDREAFCDLLAEGVERFEHVIHAFCLMTNHVHLAVEVGRLPLATIVHNLCFRHSRRFNTKHGHTGHLFERRYRAVLVETELELLRLVRYIHLNPVRAGLVRSAAAYPWGSHCCYYGAGRFSWLCTRRVLELLARRGTDAQALLSAYVDTPGEAEAAALVGAGNRLLLDSRPPPDAARVAPALRLRQITLTEVLDSVCRAAGCDLAALAAPFQTRALVRARGVAALVVRRAPHLSLRELGDQLHRDGSSLGRAAESVSRSAPRSPEVRSLLERVASALHLPPLL